MLSYRCPLDRVDDTVLDNDIADVGRRLVVNVGVVIEGYRMVVKRRKKGYSKSLQCHDGGGDSGPEIFT